MKKPKSHTWNKYRTPENLSISRKWYTRRKAPLHYMSVTVSTRNTYEIPRPFGTYSSNHEKTPRTWCNGYTISCLSGNGFYHPWNNAWWRKGKKKCSHHGEISQILYQKMLSWSRGWYLARVLIRDWYRDRETGEWWTQEIPWRKLILTRSEQAHWLCHE